MLPGPSTRLQRSIVKASYAPNRRRGAWGAHGVYLAREGAQREGERGLGFDAEREDVDLIATLRAWQRAGDERLWKFVVSPEHAASLDLREHARALVGQMQRDLGTRLDWVAIDHYNTDNPHVHLLVRTAPRIDLPRLVQFLKGGSSYAASRLPGNILGLRWSREYSATTVSPKQLAGAIRYIEEQASHHPGEGVEGAERRAGKVDRAS